MIGERLSRKKQRQLICLWTAVLLAVACVLAAGCGTQASAAEIDFSFSDRDQDPSYDGETATKILLSDGGTEISGAGAAVSGNTVTISEEGTYLVSGSLSDGQIIVDADGETKLQIVLNGASVHCESNAALYIKKADKVFLTLAPDSENSLSDGETRAFAEDEDNKVDGVIFSKADLTINGSGGLTVTGSYKHGVVSKDDLTVTGGEITVTAKGQGLYGKDCVKIRDGVFVLNTGGDGIQSDNSEDELRGFVYLYGGSFQITAEEGDGVQAETVLRIDGGDYTILTGGGSAQAQDRVSGVGFEGGRPGGSSAAAFRGTPALSGAAVGMAGNAPGQRGAAPDGGSLESTSGQGIGNPPARNLPDGPAEGAGGVPLPQNISGGALQTQEDTASTKGLKAGSQLLIYGGTFSLDTLDDALHSNGGLAVSGGEITAATGDDGAHADGDLTVSGGTLTISKSYEGLEGKTIVISGGVVDVTSSDDGLNATDGSGGSSAGGRPGPGGGDQAQDGVYILISGGTVSVDASGDGIDSNGDLTITGGTVTVNGPAGNGDGTLDYNGTAVISGGVFMGAGSSGMAQGFSDSSAQCSILWVLSEKAEAGTEILLSDESGAKIAGWTAEKQFDCVQFSSSDLTAGKTYQLTVNGATEEITLDSAAASNAPAGGRGGMGGMGQPGGDFGGQGGGRGGRGSQTDDRTAGEN